MKIYTSEVEMLRAECKEWEKVCDQHLRYINKLKKKIAKQEQGELVTWRNAAIRVGEDLCSVGPFGYYDMTAEQWLDWALSVVTVHLPPQPAQKPWVGLTVKDWDEINKQARYNFEMTTGEYAERVSHLVEDKLQELNT